MRNSIFELNSDFDEPPEESGHHATYSGIAWFGLTKQLALKAIVNMDVIQISIKDMCNGRM